MNDYNNKEDFSLSDIVVNIYSKFLNLTLLSLGIFIIILGLIATQVVFKVPTKHLYIELKSNKDSNIVETDESSNNNLNIKISDYLTIANLENTLKNVNLSDYNSAELIKYISITPATRGISGLKEYFTENKKIILKDMTVDVNQIESISKRLLSEANSRYEIQIDIGRSKLNIGDASLIISDLINTINFDLKNKYKTSQSRLKTYSMLDEYTYIRLLDRIEDINETIQILKNNFISYAPEININEIDGAINVVENDLRILASQDKFIEETITIKQLRKRSEYQSKIDIINQLLDETTRDIKSSKISLNNSASSDLIFDLGDKKNNLIDSGFFETFFKIGRAIDLSELRIDLINERKKIEYQKVEIDSAIDFYRNKLGTDNINLMNVTQKTISSNLNLITIKINKYINIINETDNIDDYFSISSLPSIDEGELSNYTLTQLFLLFLLSIILSGSAIYVKSIINRA